MKRKWLVILLCLSMIVGAVSVTAWAAEPEHKHCVCGGTLSLNGHTHSADTQWVGVSDLSQITHSGNYFLTNNVEYDKTYCPVDGVVLCLNGKNITCSAGASSNEISTVTINKGITFTVTDCQTDAGKITHKSGKIGSGVLNNGTFNMYGGKISGNTTNDSGAGVSNNENGKFNLYGGTIGGTADGEKNSAYNGGGVYNYKGTFIMNGGSISGNESTIAGGGVYNNAGKFTMENGAISKNKITGTASYAGYGGGVYNSYLLDSSVPYPRTLIDGVFTMNGGTILGNSAAHYGGGVCNVSKFTMNGGTISGNAVTSTGNTSQGGGVCNLNSDAYFTMTGGTIGGSGASDANSAKYGGGVLSSGSFEINGNIIGNSADFGGGIYNSASSKHSNISGGSIEGNTASNNGGGIYSLFELTIKNASIIGNTVTSGGYYGGGIFQGSKLYLEDVSIIGNRIPNSATNQGGGVYVSTGATTVVKGNTVIKNNINGGNVYLAAATVLTAESLGSNACIKISSVENQSVVAGSTDTAAFSCDSYDYQLVAADGGLKLINRTDYSHKHCVCGVDISEEPTHTHDVNTEWVGITSLDEINPDHKNYYLKNDVIIKNSWDPTSGNSLCLNGYSIICDASVAVISKHSNHTLTLTDCSKNETGEITHAYGRLGRGINNNLASITLWRGSIKNNTIKSVGAGVYNGDSARFYMYGGSIKNNTTIDYNHGGGVYNVSSFNMYGGTIDGNFSAGSGGGVFNYKGTFTMSGTASIKNNSTDNENNSAYGGGIDNYLGTLTMNGGEISGNKSNCGGGVYNYADTYSSSETSSGSFLMTGGTISNNEASVSGGGIYNSASKEAILTFTMSGNSVIEGNKAQNGGGVGNYGSATMTISENAQIKDNTAVSADLTGGNGGGVYNLGSGYSGIPIFKQNGGKIFSNSARRGGGIYVGNGMWSAEGGSVTGNTADYGGGVHMGSSNTITLSKNIVVTENKTATDAKDNNLYLNSTSFRISASGLTDGAKIGISLPIGTTLPATVTAETVTKNFFISDDGAYETAIDADGYVIIRVKTDPTYTVTINLPQDGSASRNTALGDLMQTVKAGSHDYKLVELVADDAHYFSSSNIDTINALLDGSGMYVSTIGDSKAIKITGTPTRNVEITVVTTAKKTHSAPDRLRGEAPSTPDGKGYLHGTGYGMEYRKEGTQQWSNCGNLGYEEVDAGYTYEVRYKDKLTDMASPISKCFVPAYNASSVAYPIPNNYIYDGAEHNGITTGSDYVVTSGTNAATDAGSYTVWVKPVDGKQWSDGTTDAKEFIWKIEKADRSTPGGVTGVRPAFAGANGGKITGVNGDMEYRLKGASEWIPCSSTEIEGLAPGDYEVRYKENANYNASEILAVNVPEANVPNNDSQGGTPSKTGDNSSTLLLIALLLVSGTAVGMTAIAKKKKYNR